MGYDNNMKGAMWWKKDKNNAHYQNGKVQIDGVDYWISVFKNPNKKQDNHPDFNISVSKAK